MSKTHSTIIRIKTTRIALVASGFLRIYLFIDSSTLPCPENRPIVSITQKCYRYRQSIELRRQRGGKYTRLISSRVWPLQELVLMCGRNIRLRSQGDLENDTDTFINPLSYEDEDL